MKRFTYGFFLLTIFSLFAITANAQPGWGNRGQCRTGENDTLRELVTVTGTIIATQDTAYCNGEQYYLDTDGDGIGDYRLSFGPFWYSPDGMTRPVAGATVTIVGYLNTLMTPNVIRVYTLDGKVWRDTTAGHPGWGGGWAGRHGYGIHASDSSFCQFPDSSWGRHMGGGHGHMGGMRWSDSVHTRFDTCQTPFWNGNTRMKAWTFTVTSAMGSMMMGDGSGTSYVEFNMPCTINLRYDEGEFGDESAVAPYRFNGETWERIENFTLDTETNTVTFEENPLHEFYGITADAATGIAPVAATAETVELAQNYPNPFNPSTVIPFTLEKSGNIHLAVYDAAGKLVATLADDYMDAGSYTMQFNADGIDSGVYFYRLTVNGTVTTKAMTLTK